MTGKIGIDLVSLSNDMQKLRKQKGWTRNRLAEVSGVSVTAVTMFEEHRVKPRLDTILDLLEALGYCLVLQEVEA